VEKSPISVMVRGTLERVLGAEQLDAWFARTAQKQYTRTVLFSTVYDALLTAFAEMDMRSVPVTHCLKAACL
jgi:hypothetical protein